MVFNGARVGVGAIEGEGSVVASVDDTAWRDGRVRLTPGWNMLEKGASNWINTVSASVQRSERSDGNNQVMGKDSKVGDPRRMCIVDHHGTRRETRARSTTAYFFVTDTLHQTQFDSESLTADNNYNSSISWTDVAGAATSIAFTGSTFLVYGTTGPLGGQYEVTLDEQVLGVYSAQAPSRL